MKIVYIVYALNLLETGIKKDRVSTNIFNVKCLKRAKNITIPSRTDLFDSQTYSGDRDIAGVYQICDRSMVTIIFFIKNH